MATTVNRKEQIINGHLVLRPGQFSQHATRFGRRKTVSGAASIAGRVAKSHPTGALGLHIPASKTTAVGQAPEGFGKWVEWRDSDRELALMVFINSADPMGVGVLGVNATDRFELVAAVGHASFSQETENEGISSAIGIVAAGANLTASAFGFPEAAPLIGAAERFAQDQYKEKEVKTKVRDAYGEEPRTKHKARQEGGVLICMPGARGVYTSGEDEKFWVKKPGNRINANRPDHVKKAVFIRRGMGPVTSTDAGELFMLAWDHNFSDNVGFYKLHVLMKRGSGRVPKAGGVE